MKCNSCNETVEYDAQVHVICNDNGMGLLCLPGFVCDSCKTFMLLKEFYMFVADHIHTHYNIKENPRMECPSCLSYMEYKRDLYVVAAATEECPDFNCYLPGYLCQSCEKTCQHPYTVDFLKKTLRA